MRLFRSVVGDFGWVKNVETFGRIAGRETENHKPRFADETQKSVERYSH